MLAVVRIEIVSDFVCPWCFVGQARLAAALASRPAVAAELVWLPFELNPQLPAEGRDRAEYLRERFGDVNRFADAQRQLHEIGAQLGIRFDFAAIRRMPNTRLAQVMMAAARRYNQDSQNQLARQLFEAYFSAGADIGDRAVLLDIAERCALDRSAVTTALDDNALVAEVVALEALVGRWGVSGVPTFIFDRKHAFSGAQPLEVFLQAIDAVSSDAVSSDAVSS